MAIINWHLVHCHGGGIEAAGRTLECRHRELVQLESGQLGADQVDAVFHVAETVLRSDRELRRIIEARIVEPALTMRVQVSDEGVPIVTRPFCNLLRGAYSIGRRRKS